MNGILTATTDLLERLRDYDRGVKRCRGFVDRDDAVRWLTPINGPLTDLHDLLNQSGPPSEQLTWDAYQQETDEQRGIELVRRVVMHDLYGLRILAGDVSMARLFPEPWERQLPSFEKASNGLEFGLELLERKPQGDLVDAGRIHDTAAAPVRIGGKTNLDEQGVLNAYCDHLTRQQQCVLRKLWKSDHRVPIRVIANSCCRESCGDDAGRKAVDRTWNAVLECEHYSRFPLDIDVTQEGVLLKKRFSTPTK